MITKGTSTKKIWIGAGVLFTTMFVGKQWLLQEVLDEVIENRAKHHEEAALHLQNAYKTSNRYALPPLTKEEALKMKEIVNVQDISKFK